MTKRLHASFGCLATQENRKSPPLVPDFAFLQPHTHAHTQVSFVIQDESFNHLISRLSARSQLKGDNLVKEVEIEIMSREQRPRTPPSSLAHYRSRSRSPRDDFPNIRLRRELPAATLVQPDTEISIFSNNYMTPSTSIGPTTPQGSTSTLDENTVVPFSSSSSSGTVASSQGCSCHLKEDLESIHSTPESGAAENPHQMVVGTGGLVCQIVERDQHPDFTDTGESITLKFKIFDPEYFEEATDIPLGNPGGNYEEKLPNPPHRCFKPVPPIVQDPERLRKDLLSPMELEGLGTAEENDLQAFLRLQAEALNQPRKDQPPWRTAGLMMEKPEEKQECNKSNNSSSTEHRPRGVPRSTPTGRCTTGFTREKSSTKKGWKSKWRKFIRAMRRLLSPGF